jgi:hypothetical protein
MGLTQTNALVSIAVGTGSSSPQAPNATLTALAGATLTFSLQSITLIQAWVITIQCDDSFLNGRVLQWNPGQANQLVLPTPAAAYVLSYQSLVSDGAGSTASVVGGVISAGTGLAINPAPLPAQAPFSTGGNNYRPAGMREVVNMASQSPVGDGTTDDWGALQSALDSITIGSNVEVLLPRSAAAPMTTLTQTCTMYALSEPLVINDAFVAGPFNTLGNGCRRLRGENRDSVGLMPTWNGAYEQPNWLGPLLIVGVTSDTNQAAFVTDTGMTCLSFPSANNPGYSINYSEYDTGDINGQSGFCWETWLNPLSDQPTTFTYELASSHGAIKNIENHTAFSLQRLNVGSGNQIVATLVTTQGGGTTTTSGSQTMPAVQTLTTLAFGSTAAMTAALAGIQTWSTGSMWVPSPVAGGNPTSGYPYLTIAGFGTLILVSVTDGTHAVVINPNFSGNALPGTSLPNGTAVGIEGMTTVSTTLGTDLTLNSLNHVAVDWDGSHLRLWLNGSQPDSSMTAALSGGTILQRWYEEFVVGQSRFGSWPSADGSIYGQSGVSYHQGTNRLRDTSTYTSAFTPTPATVVCGDGHNKIVVNFAFQSPASNGFGLFPGTSTPRVSLATEWLIGRTDAQHASRPRTAAPAGVTPGMPVWLRMSMSQVPYTQNAAISDLYFYGNCLRGIEFNSALYSRLHRCNFSGLAQGVNWQNYSYGSSYEDLWFSSNGTIGTGFHHWNLLHGHGGQAMTHGERVISTFCSTAWHCVHTFADLTIHKAFLGGHSQGAFAFVCDAGDVVDLGATIDDESAGEQCCCYLLSHLVSFEKKAGTAFNANNGASLIKVGSCAHVDLACSSFATTTQPIISFGYGQNGGVPVKWNGSNALSTSQVVDAINPGPLYIPAQESFGVHTITFPTDANYAILQNPADAFWREYLIASGTISTTRTLTWPSNPGKIYVGRNNNAHSVTLMTLSGAAGVTVTSGSTFKVQDQSSGMVSL